MDLILCTASSTDYNDAVVPGLVHFSLSSHLKNNDLIYAVYRDDINTLHLFMQDHSSRKITPKAHKAIDGSDRYLCVRQLLSGMKSGDRLMVQALSDLGATAEEASDLYFHAIEEGIVVSFYDAGYIDSHTLALDSTPSAEEKRLVRRIINNYYHQKDNAPVLSKDELTTLAGLPATKKKSDA